MTKSYLNYFPKRQISKLAAVFLVFFLLIGEAGLITARQARSESLNPLFDQAVMNYQDGRYRDVLGILDQLMSFLDNNPKDHYTLEGKILLLKGATCEKIGRTRQASQSYKKAAELLKNPEIEGLDFSFLPLYQQIIKGKTLKPTVKKKVIAKAKPAPRKKRSKLLWILGGIALAGGIAAYFLLKKKNDDFKVDPTYDTNVLQINWVDIQGGTFYMGDVYNDGDQDELPLHKVTVQDYYISRYEITVGQYTKYLQENDLPWPDVPSTFAGYNQPMVYITWADAYRFCQWLSKKTGKLIRLPTEAQWEFAAKGFTQNRYPWGNMEPSCDRTNWGCDNVTHSVGHHVSGGSPFNVQDMAGNAAEWILDFYDSDYYANCPENEPYRNTPATAFPNYHVVRGGSYNTGFGMGIRCSDRFYALDYSHRSDNMNQGYRSTNIGFRIVWVAGNI